MTSQTPHVRKAPRWALLFALGLIALATMSALVTPTGKQTATQQAALPPPTETLLFRLEDGTAGEVRVLQAGSNRVLAVMKSGTNGFFRTVMRSLAQERLRNGHDRTLPFRLSWWAKGRRLAVTDPATGKTVNLLAFGVANAKTFARLLTAAPNRRPQDAGMPDKTVHQ